MHLHKVDFFLYKQILSRLKRQSIYTLIYYQTLTLMMTYGASHETKQYF